MTRKSQIVILTSNLLAWIRGGFVCLCLLPLFLTAFGSSVRSTSPNVRLLTMKCTADRPAFSKRPCNVELNVVAGRPVQSMWLSMARRPAGGMTLRYPFAAGSKTCVSSSILKAKTLRFDPSYGSRASVFAESGTELHAAKSKIDAKGASKMRCGLRFDKPNIAVHLRVKNNKTNISQ